MIIIIIIIIINNENNNSDSNNNNNSNNDNNNNNNNNKSIHSKLCIHTNSTYFADRLPESTNIFLSSEEDRWKSLEISMLLYYKNKARGDIFEKKV